MADRWIDDLDVPVEVTDPGRADDQRGGQSQTPTMSCAILSQISD